MARLLLRTALPSPSQVLGSLLARSPSSAPCRSRGAAEDGRSRCRIPIPEGGRGAGEGVLAADSGRPLEAAALDEGVSGDECSSPSQPLSIPPPLRGGTRAAETGRPPPPPLCCCCFGDVEGLRGAAATFPALEVVLRWDDAPPLLLPTATADGRAPPVDDTEAAGRAEEAVGARLLLLLFGRAEAGRLDEPDTSDLPGAAAPPKLPPPPLTASISWSSSPPLSSLMKSSSSS